MALLTDQILATGVSSTDLIHIVDTSDPTQNPAGSSFKATIAQLATAIGSPGFSGGTVPFNTYFSSSLSANTFSATTYLNLPGSSSGNCLSDFYVSNIHSCSPLNINPLDEGNIIFGSSNQVYIDLLNNRIGLNKIPNFNIDATGSGGGRFVFRDTNNGGIISLIKSSSATTTNYLEAGSNSFEITVIGDNSLTSIGSVTSGDTILSTNSGSNNLVFNTSPGSARQKDIRFWAGKTPDTKPDFRIIGTGSTRGNVEISSSLNVGGNAVVSSGLTASTINISSTPTTDQTNDSVLVRDNTSGLIKQRIIPTSVGYGIYSQTGDSQVVSGVTEQTIINGGVGTLSVGSNQFQVGDSFIAFINGHLSNNNDSFNIRVKSGSVILADSGLINFDTSGDDEIFSLQINFTIIQTGGTGVAEIFTRGSLSTTKLSNFSVKGFAFEDNNNTTFDTTTSNTLDVTFEFNATDPQTYVYSDFFVLNKVY